jgi:hypothetical protein
VPDALRAPPDFIGKNLYARSVVLEEPKDWPVKAARVQVMASPNTSDWSRSTSPTSGACSKTADASIAPRSADAAAEPRPSIEASRTQNSLISTTGRNGILTPHHRLTPGVH